MHFARKAVALAVAAVFPSFSAAESFSESLAPVIVSATGIDQADVDAPYASEVHLRETIEQSGAVTLYDYLSRHTSVNVMPSYGNRFTPAIDMRGYGGETGHQNLVVTLDGRRLNNVDTVPQLIGSIPLADIERIEITKGSGSVRYGDGAMAGTIQIYTRQRTGATLEGYVGSHGEQGLSASAGFAQDRFALSASADQSRHGGFSKRDPDGKHDQSRADNWRVSLSGQPVDPVRLSLDVASARIDTRYPGPLTREQFKRDPAQNNGNSYTHQKFDSDYWQVGAEFDLGGGLTLNARHSHEDKQSEYVAGSNVYDYDYRATDLELQYQRDALVLTAGYQVFDGEREGSASKTDKDNTAWFLHGQYSFDRLTLSAGWRNERVKYAYRPEGGERLRDSETLSAWDVGANYRIDDNWSVFANYNSAFQAPDIDRFFDFGGNFNEFIDPAKVRTVNMGFNHVTDTNRLKVTAFYSRLRDEIYYSPFGVNTNIDRSKKYGVEVQHTWLLNDRFTTGLNYAWTRAIIDREDEGAGAYNGKDLPGVSRHSLVASLNAKVGGNGNFNVSHTWRSRAYAEADFTNNNAPKQRAYHSTDVSYRHALSHDIELFAAVGNLFDRENGMGVWEGWRSRLSIYPIDFTRTWRVGANISF